MTSRVPASPLRRRVTRHYAALRRALALRQALRAAAWTCAITAVAVALGVPRPPGETLAWIRTIAVVVLGAGAIGLAVARFLSARPSFDAYLERVEERFPAVRSWLRNALDFEGRSPAHTSAELAGAVSAEAARRLAAVPLPALEPPLRARRPVAAMAVALGTVIALGLAFPAPTERSWRTLLDPRAAAPPVRLVVEPGSATVTPGAALTVRARVWGTAARPRLLRGGLPPLDGLREGQGEAGERMWRFDLSQLTRAMEYRVRVAATESPRYRISLAGSPQPVSFEVEIQPPAYARLPVQRGAATRGDLSALRGSSARVEVLFDRDLESLEAFLPGGPPRPWTARNPRHWRGQIPIRQAGEYELHARASSGEGRFRYRIQPLADAPPILTVRVPQGDLNLPAGQQVPCDVLCQDDLGLTELLLQVRKDPEAPWTNVPLTRFTGEPREAQVSRHWDASPLSLLPGESASFRFLLFDDNRVDGRGVATSPTYELRFPLLSELYRDVDARQESAQDALEKVAERARELQKSLDNLARRAPAPNTGAPRSFERQEEVKSALERQQDLARQLDEATRQMREGLEQAAERRAFDEQLTRKLRELAEIMDQIQTKEFRDAMRRLRETLENLPQRPQDPRVQDWRRQNEQLLKNIERSIELMKQLREEERLQALAQRAQEMKERQDRLNQRQEETSPGETKENQPGRSDLAMEQERAASESERIAQDTRQLGEEMTDPGAATRLEEAAREMEGQAAPSQRGAAQALQQNRMAQARQSGQQASQSLQRAAQQLRDAANAIQQNRQEVDLAAVRRSAQDLVSLQRGVESNVGSSAPLGERADRQTDLSEGAARVADSLAALAEKTPFISQSLGEALGRAIGGLQRSGREMGQGNRLGGERTGREAADALIEAALQLRQTEAAMCKRPGPGQQGGSVPMRMDALGQRQGQLNDRSRSLAERLTQAARLSAGDREELRRMADEQERIRRELEDIAREDELKRQLLGRLDQTAQEMKEVEEALQQAKLGDEVEQKQQHILSRLLDAQRSVNRQDFDPRRESRPGQDVVRPSPPGLPTDLLRESDRLRLGLLKAQADRYPAQYRAFIEAYLRALNAGGTP